MPPLFHAHGHRASGRRRRGSGPSATILTFEVLGPTVLPDGTDAAIMNGSAVKVTLPYDALATFDPTKILVTVQDPGFSAPNVAATRTRFIQGGKIIRLQNPNGANRHYTNAGGIATVYFSLEDPIYATAGGASIVGVQAAAGYYGAAQAGAVSTGAIVNSSTRTYPAPQIAFVNMQQVRATGANYGVEAYISHRHAMNNRAVAGVEFIGTDHLGNAAPVQQATLPALSDLITSAFRPEVYKASIPQANFTNATLSTHFSTCDLDVYPWIGTKYRLSTNGTAWPTANADTVLRFVCDKNGTYGGAHAAVKTGAATGAVAASYAAAIANPFPTVEAAANALAAWNNTNKGHNDHSGATVWLMEASPGAGASYTPATNFAPVAGSCWTEFVVDPAATGLVEIQMSTANRQIASLFHFKVPIRQTTNFGFNGGVAIGNVMVAFTDTTLTLGGGVTPINYRCGLGWFRNCTVTGLSSTGHNPFFSNFAGERMQCVQIAGCSIIGTAELGMVAGFAAGNTTQRVKLTEYSAAFVNHDTLDGSVLVNNVTRNLQSATTLASVRNISKGLALIQNVIEKSTVAGVALQISADGATNTVDNVVMFHNTIPGGTEDARFNGFYNDVAGAVGVQKKGCLKFNIFSKFNTKTDTYTTNTAVTGRTGNWERIYTVGDDGNVVMAGATSGETAPGYSGPPGNWLGEYWEAGSSTNTTKAAIGFTDDKAGGPGFTGLGTYSLTGPVNAAYNRVRANRAVCAFDIVGVARRNDGTGAAGAYERTV